MSAPGTPENHERWTSALCFLESASRDFGSAQGLLDSLTLDADAEEVSLAIATERGHLETLLQRVRKVEQWEGGAR